MMINTVYSNVHLFTKNLLSWMYGTSIITGNTDNHKTLQKQSFFTYEIIIKYWD